jgi:Zn-dependent peptidase ImmA (M78 family)
VFFLVRKFRKIRLNRHVFTVDDARKLCRENEVNIQECDIEQDGFYIKVRGQATIYVKRGMHPIKWLYVVLHELAHHLLHASNYQNAAFFCLDGQDSKQHHEAEAFALMAILPAPYLRRLEKGDLLNELEDIPRELVAKRFALLFEHHI